MWKESPGKGPKAERVRATHPPRHHPPTSALLFGTSEETLDRELPS